MFHMAFSISPKWHTNAVVIIISIDRKQIVARGAEVNLTKGNRTVVSLSENATALRAMHPPSIIPKTRIEVTLHTFDNAPG